jgi:dephospho-CoA kinase
VFKIGLTGGIGSGKTAASDRFARLGVSVIDTDLLSRELVEPGQPALAEIAQAFGRDVLDAAGRLDRAALRQCVFADPSRRRRLEAILHPRIREAMLARAEAAGGPYVICVIPLLVETGQQALVDRVLVIDAPPQRQRERVIARDGVATDAVDAILASQVDRATRLAAADDIVNDGGVAELHAQVDALHRRYIELATDR